MKIARVLCLIWLLVSSVFLFSLEISCPLPEGDYYTIQSVPHKVDLERIIGMLYGDKPYAMSLSIQYSPFRNFHDREGKSAVETGFPNYTGIFYTVSAAADETYFQSHLARYFGTSNIALPPVAVTESGGKTVYRTRPRSIDGIPVIFDAEYAGDGAEMTVEDAPGGKRIALKFSWHEPGNRTKITNAMDIGQILRASAELTDKTIVKIEPCYYYSADDCYQPAIMALASDGNKLYFDIQSGQTVPKYRVLTGR